MDHPFKVGERYANRLGAYQVIEITPPVMRVQYEHGGMAILDIVTQARILHNVELQKLVDALPPPKQPATRSRTSTVRAAATATATAPPRERAPRAKTVRATDRRTPLPTWAALRDASRDERAQVLRNVLGNRESFLALIDSALQAEQGRYWTPALAEVQTLNQGEQLTRTSPPDLFLAHSIAQDRGYLAGPQQEVLARQFPINESSDTCFRVDLLGYDTAEQRPLIMTVRVRTTTVQWLWEALFQALDYWVALRGAPGFAANLGEREVSAVPAVGVVAPRAYWQENSGQKSAAARGQAVLSQELITALRTWIDVPVLLLEVDDDWLRRVGSPQQPAIRTASWSA
jgi:hypothetical protein